MCMMMMKRPRQRRNRPSTTRINGILSVGLSMSVRFQFYSSLDMSDMMYRDDLGIRGVQVLRTLYPLLKTPTVNCSIKLFETPTPIEEVGEPSEW